MNNKTPNHDQSPLSCPHTLEDVDLFAPGAQEHWYEAYPILHREAPVLRLPGEGIDGKGDGFVLNSYEDIERVVKDPERFTPLMTLKVEEMQSMLDQGEQLPNDASRFDLAMEFENIHKFDKAIEVLEEILSHSPDNEAAIYEIAYCYERTGDFDKCIEFYNRYIDNNPYSFTAWYNLGNIYFLKGNVEKAI